MIKIIIAPKGSIKIKSYEIPIIKRISVKKYTKGAVNDIANCIDSFITLLIIVAEFLCR